MISNQGSKRGQSNFPVTNRNSAQRLLFQENCSDPFSSVHVGAAVDDQRLAGDEVAVGGGEEGDRADQVLGLLQALERPRGCGGLAIPDDALVGIFLAQGAPRRDAVDAY